jgi:hypothetical protein
MLLALGEELEHRDFPRVAIHLQGAVIPLERLLHEPKHPDRPRDGRGRRKIDQHLDHRLSCAPQTVGIA